MPDSPGSAAPSHRQYLIGPQAGLRYWRPAAPRDPLVSQGPDTPLAGLTLLAVEDSRFASDALRLMAQRSGARLRRVETLAAARHHLRVYRPDVIILDPGLPDGEGLSLLDDLRHPAVRGAPPVLVLSGQPDIDGRARAAGAAAFMTKPVAGLAAFQRAICACLPDRAWLSRREEGATPLPAPDPLALRDDLTAAARRLSAGPDDREGRYLAGFVAGLARATGDTALAAAAAGAAQPGPQAMRRLAGTIADRLRISDPAALVGR